MSRRVIAVDFDCTLCTDSKLGPPDAVVARLVRSLIDKGHFVVVYSARLREDQHLVEAWLLQHKINADAVVMGKLRFDLLIDDKTLNPTSKTLVSDVEAFLKELQ